MAQPQNRNMRDVRKLVQSMGGTIERTLYGGKHVQVLLRNSEGQLKMLTLSHYRIDPYILKGWVRQALTGEGKRNRGR